MFNLFRRWFGWDGLEFNPNGLGPITRQIVELDLTTTNTIEMSPTLQTLPLDLTTLDTVEFLNGE